MSKGKKIALRSKKSAFTFNDLCDFEERRDRGELTRKDAELEAAHEEALKATEPIVKKMADDLDVFYKRPEGREAIHGYYGRDDIDPLSREGISRLRPILWQFSGLTKDEFLGLTPGQAWDLLELWHEREQVARPIEVRWSKPDFPSQWARVFDISRNEMTTLLKQGTIRNKRISARKYSIAVDDLPPSYFE